MQLRQKVRLLDLLPASTPYRETHIYYVCAFRTYAHTAYLNIAGKTTTTTTATTAAIKMSEKVIVFRENYIRSERNNFFLDIS